MNPILKMVGYPDIIVGETCSIHMIIRYNTYDNMYEIMITFISIDVIQTQHPSILGPSSREPRPFSCRHHPFP